MQSFEPGQIVRFTYNNPSEDEITDHYKEVFVLNGNNNGKVEGLDMKKISPADREVLQAIMDPEAKKKPPHRLPIVNDVLKRMDPLVEIKNPLAFYAKFVKPFLKNKDAYRSYFHQRMSNATVVAKSQVVGAAQGTAVATNQKPLFHGITPKEGAAPEKKPLFSLPPLHGSRKGSTIKPRIERPKRQRAV